MNEKYTLIFRKMLIHSVFKQKTRCFVIAKVVLGHKKENFAHSP